MQYYQPPPPNFVGDCMPSSTTARSTCTTSWTRTITTAAAGSAGTSGAVHHARPRDWTHHGLVIPMDRPGEGSICTGSVFFHEGVFHAFYATRMTDRTEHGEPRDKPRRRAF